MLSGGRESRSAARARGSCADERSHEWSQVGADLGPGDGVENHELGENEARADCAEGRHPVVEEIALVHGFSLVQPSPRGSPAPAAKTMIIAAAMAMAMSQLGRRGLSDMRTPSHERKPEYDGDEPQQCHRRYREKRRGPFFSRFHGRCSSGCDGPTLA